MKPEIKAVWDANTGHETKVVLGAAFRKLSRIEQLDFLSDIIGTLEMEYNGILKNQRSPMCFVEPE